MTDYYTFNKKCTWTGKTWVMPKVLHPQFEELIEWTKADKRYIKFQKELLKSETKERWEEDRRAAKALRAEKKRLEEKESKIIDVIADTDSKITRQKMEAKIEEIAIRITTIDSKLENLESNDDILENVMNTAFEIMQDPLKYRNKWDTDQKRLLLNLLFRKPLEVNRNQQTFWTIELSPMFLLSEQFNAWVLQNLEHRATILNNIFNFTRSSKKEHMKLMIHFYIMMTDSKEEAIQRYWMKKCESYWITTL